MGRKNTYLGVRLDMKLVRRGSEREGGKGGNIKGNTVPTCPAVPRSSNGFRKVREREIERVLVETVAAAGGIAYKFTSPARRGVPDRLIVLPGGCLFFAELKGDGGRLSKLQEVEITRLRQLGVRVEVVTGLDEARGIAR